MLQIKILESTCMLFISLTVYEILELHCIIRISEECYNNIPEMIDFTLLCLMSIKLSHIISQ